VGISVFFAVGTAGGRVVLVVGIFVSFGEIISEDPEQEIPAAMVLISLALTTPADTREPGADIAETTTAEIKLSAGPLLLSPETSSTMPSIVLAWDRLLVVTATCTFIPDEAAPRRRRPEQLKTTFTSCAGTPNKAAKLDCKLPLNADIAL